MGQRGVEDWVLCCVCCTGMDVQRRVVAYRAAQLVPNDMSFEQTSLTCEIPLLSTDEPSAEKRSPTGLPLFRQHLSLRAMCRRGTRRFRPWAETGACSAGLCLNDKRGCQSQLECSHCGIYRRCIDYPPCPAKKKILKKYGPNRSVRWTRRLLDTGGGGGLQWHPGVKH